MIICLTALEPSVMWMSHLAFTQGSGPGPLQVLAVVNSAAVCLSFGDTGTCLCWIELLNLRVDVCSAFGGVVKITVPVYTLTSRV